jgi:hypothetical protein
MKRSQLVAWCVAVLALVAGVATLLIPARAGGEFTPDGFHSNLFLSVVTAILQLGAAVLFVWGFKGFRQQLRVAYGAICAGVVVLGFANLQLPLLAYFNLIHSVLVSSGLILLPYITSVVLVFFGVKRLARLFEVKTIWMSFWFVLALSTVCAAAVGGLGAALKPGDSAEHLANTSLSAWTAVFLFANLLVVLRVKKVAGVMYHNALNWFAAARVVNTLTGAGYTIILLVIGSDTFITEYGLIMVPSLLAAFLFLRSGYSFKLINEDHGRPAEAAGIPIIDAVIFAASQASNPKQLDKELNTLRVITSNLQLGSHTLTPQQTNELKKLYLVIERYLVEAEPLRQFTVEQLRRKGAAGLGLDDNAFAALVTPSPDPPNTIAHNI